MNHMDLVRLTPLMELTRGTPEIVVGLIDGPVMLQHPAFSDIRMREYPGGMPVGCSQVASTACMHGTFVAGILGANRDYHAPSICPDCTLFIRPIFSESSSVGGQVPSATPRELAAALIECIEAGVSVVNMSLGLAELSDKSERELEEALNYAVRRGVIVVAAAGNQGTFGSSVITRHPWVIPVVACNLNGRPTNESNLSNTIGKHGLSAPGERITSLGVYGEPLTLSGTSVAAPFVTGAIALLWSKFLEATAAEVKLAVTQANTPRRITPTPPLLDAWAGHQILLNAQANR